MLVKNWCECEHECHFDNRKHTPNGNPAHKYGSTFEFSYIVPVRTPYGTMQVCKDCANDCYSPERMAKLGVK